MSVGVAREGEIARWNEDVGGRTRRRRRLSEGACKSTKRKRGGPGQYSPQSALVLSDRRRGESSVLGRRPTANRQSQHARQGTAGRRGGGLAGRVMDLSSAHSSPRRCMQMSRVASRTSWEGLF
jgi:hypothetical protein